MIALVVGILTFAAGIACAEWTRRTWRENRARGQREGIRRAWEHAALAGDSVAYILKIAEDVELGNADLGELDDELGEEFFDAMHGEVGLTLLRARSQSSMDLYSKWYRHRDSRASHARRKPGEIGSEEGIRRWKRIVRSSETQSGRVLWHHNAHEGLGEAKLVFWRLRFEPRYEKDDLLDFIEASCEHFGVESYVVYEMLGPHDLLLRCWVPARRRDSPDCLGKLDAGAGCEVPDEVLKMQRHLEGKPGGAKVRCDFFLVTRIRRHWWWHEGSAVSPPTAEDLAFLQDSRAKDGVRRLVKAYNAGERSFADLKRDKDVSQFERRNLLRHGVLRDGIKFATVIREPAGASDGDAGHVLASAPDGSPRKPPSLTPGSSIGDHLEMVVGEAKGLCDRSLYEGRGFSDGVPDGELPHFLILGRVEANSDFMNIREQIIEPLVGTPTIAKHYAPPLTYVMTGPEVTRQTCQDVVSHSYEEEDAA